MEIRFEAVGGTSKFVVDRFDEKYLPALHSLFYQPEGTAYVKSFAADLVTDDIRRNFSRSAKDMFDQIGGFAAVPWERALELFAGLARAASIDWWLTGSGALAVRGLAVRPHDLDIMLFSADMARVRSALAQHIVEPIIPTSGWVMKHFGVAFLEARLDLAFDPEPAVDSPEPVDFGPYALERLETVAWHGFDLRVPPASLHLTSNRRRGRLDRVALIEEYLAGRD